MLRNIFSPYSIDSHGIKNYSVIFSVVVSFIILAMTISICAHYILGFEIDNTISNIKTYGDAVWVLTMVASTIGFGDYYPITTEGRIVAGFISFIGMGLYSYITSTLVLKIMSWTYTETKNRELRSQNAKIIELYEMILVSNNQSIKDNQDIKKQISHLEYLISENTKEIDGKPYSILM